MDCLHYIFSVRYERNDNGELVNIGKPWICVLCGYEGAPGEPKPSLTYENVKAFWKAKKAKSLPG